MKKKILAILILSLFIFVVAACAGGPPQPDTAYDIYTRAGDAFHSYESLAADSFLTMTVLEDEEEGNRVEETCFIKVINVSETEAEVQWDIYFLYCGSPYDDFKSFYKDGVHYFDENYPERDPRKYSMKRSVEDILGQIAIRTEILSFPDTAVKRQEATQKDGGYELIFILDGEALHGEVLYQLGYHTYLFTGGVGGDDYYWIFDDLEYIVFIDGQGDLKTTRLNYSVELVSWRIAMPICGSIIRDYLQLGDVTIDFPDDLDAYPSLYD